MRPRFGVPDAAFVQPLVFGLDAADAPFETVRNTPAHLAVQFKDRIPLFEGGCVFLSPFDYARYGAEYCIVPDVCVASSSATGTARLYINEGVSNIRTMAVDLRVTAEIILAKILLIEKFRNLSTDVNDIRYVPITTTPEAMLANADAALAMNFGFEQPLSADAFFIDLVEEWHDLTELPYVHGFWVGREDNVAVEDVQRLIRAKREGVASLDLIATRIGRQRNIPHEQMREYLHAFSYTLGEAEEESITEFIRFAFYHGILPDAPDLNYFDVPIPPPLARN
jgi:predicted solute-binding protein